MASKNKQIVAKSDKLAKNVKNVKAIEASAPVVLPLPDGMVNYVAKDELMGIVFVSCQVASRAYVSALVCDSPVGVIVARWSRDHKALLRTAKAIIAGKGTAGLSNPRVVPVSATTAPVDGATATVRRREADYYGSMGITGPNHAAREAAKLAREAAKLAFLAARESEGVQGPAQE